MPFSARHNEVSNTVFILRPNTGRKACTMHFRLSFYVYFLKNPIEGFSIYQRDGMGIWVSDPHPLSLGKGTFAPVRTRPVRVGWLEVNFFMPIRWFLILMR